MGFTDIHEYTEHQLYPLNRTTSCPYYGYYWYLHPRYKLTYCFRAKPENLSGFYICNFLHQLRWWWVMLGWIHYHAPVHHCINLLSDALCGSIFRGEGGKAFLCSWLAVPVPATLGIEPPCCCLLRGQSSKCHGTSGARCGEGCAYMCGGVGGWVGSGGGGFETPPPLKK